MSEHSWIVAVLDDLENYAQKNELSSLSQELVRTKGIAMSEINRELGKRQAPKKLSFRI